MTAVAELLDPGAAARLAALRAELGHQVDANPKPGNLNSGPPVCGACGQRLRVPAAVFRSGAEQDAAVDTFAVDADPMTRARA